MDWDIDKATEFLSREFVGKKINNHLICGIDPLEDEFGRWTFEIEYDDRETEQWTVLTTKATINKIGVEFKNFMKMI